MGPDVIQLLGEPELIENTKREYTKKDILDLRYPRKGIEFTIDKSKQMCVIRIERCTSPSRVPA
jgi:hypothetical protein